MLTTQKIGFIGGGNMAEALLKGLVAGAVPPKNIFVADPAQGRLDHLRKTYGVTTNPDNRAVVNASDLLILAIKPQQAAEVLTGFADLLGTQKVLVSILAGIDTATLERPFDGEARVVRAMPNTPALVGRGATALCPGRFAEVDDLLLARNLFELVGEVVTVSEAQMDAVTGLSGSGPAYVYAFIEALADGGVLEGLPRDTALTLAAQTVMGAAGLVLESGEHPAQLKDRVCSPAGTTIAGMKALEEQAFRGTAIAAVSAASRRSRQLGGRDA